MEYKSLYIRLHFAIGPLNYGRGCRATYLVRTCELLKAELVREAKIELFLSSRETIF